MSLTVPQLAERVERLRPAVLAAKQREFPRLAMEDLEDAYSQAVERILSGGAVFEEEAQLAGYLHRAVSNLARNQIRGTAWQAESLDEDDGDRRRVGDHTVMDPEDRLLAAHARMLLSEFLAELSEHDRRIAYLRLDPAYECTPRQIARDLNLPYQEVRGSLRRTSVNLSRFQGLLARPGGFCQRRRPDVVEWQRTGVVPLALRIHLSHCTSCRAQHQSARVAVRHAILPLLPAAGLPAARAGVLSRLWHAAGAHPITQRIDDTMSRWRKVAPVGGGGGAAIAAKLATAGTIATVGGVTAALHAITTHLPTHPHRTAHTPVHNLAIHRLTINSTPSTPSGAVAARSTARPAAHTATTTTTARAAVPPPPNANPSPSTSGHGSSSQVKTARASTANTTTSSSSQSSTSTAYVPAPNQNNASSTSPSNSHANNGTASSGPATPGGPPAP